MKHLLILIIFLFSSSCASSTYNYNKRRLNVEKAYNSVAMIITSNEARDEGRVATGFAYSSNYIITAKHFCNNIEKGQKSGDYTDDIRMEYYDEKYNSIVKGGLKIYKVSDVHDICIIKKKNHGLAPMNIVKNYDIVRVGDEIAAIGGPAGRAIGEFGGRVMAPFYYGRGEMEVVGTLLVSSASTGGISGSPVILTKTGDVIGMIIIVNRYFSHLSYCVNGEVLGEFIDSLELE